MHGGQRPRNTLVSKGRQYALQIRGMLHVVTQHQDEHHFGEPIQHAPRSRGAGLVLGKHQSRDSMQLSRCSLVFAAHHDRRRQGLHE